MKRSLAVLLVAAAFAVGAQAFAHHSFAATYLEDQEMSIEGDLVQFLADKEIAKFKLPERLLICADFPVSTFGKVSKKALTEMAAKHAHH